MVRSNGHVYTLIKPLRKQHISAPSLHLGVPANGSCLACAVSVVLWTICALVIVHKSRHTAKVGSGPVVLQYAMLADQIFWQLVQYRTISKRFRLTNALLLFIFGASKVPTFRIIVVNGPALLALSSISDRVTCTKELTAMTGLEAMLRYPIFRGFGYITDMKLNEPVEVCYN